MTGAIFYLFLLFFIGRFSQRLFRNAYHINENSVTAEQQYTISELVEKLKEARREQGKVAKTKDKVVAALYAAEIDSEVIRTLTGKPWIADVGTTEKETVDTSQDTDTEIYDMTNVTNIWDAPNPDKYDDYDPDYDDD